MCKHNIGGSIDGCLLFDPLNENVLLCDSYNFYRNFYFTRLDLVSKNVVYIKLVNGEVDGCQIFMPIAWNMQKHLLGEGVDLQNLMLHLYC